MSTSRGGTLLGVVFLLLGIGGFVASLLQHPIPTVPLSLSAGIAILGGLMINPTSVKSGAKDLGEVVGPYIPVIGRSGRRETDPVAVAVPKSPGGADPDK